MHEIGPWYTDNGSMISRITGTILDEDIAICISIDADDNLLIAHKVGKMKQIRTYYDTTVQKLVSRGCQELASEWKLISFNVQYPEFSFAPEGYNFTIDEICTLINWWNNSPGTEGSKILSMSIDEAKDKLEMLSRIGF